MKNTGFVLCLLTVVSSVLPRVHRDIHPYDIVGGDAVDQDELPYQVSLRNNGRHFCGGSIAVVNGRQVIITAAHCFDDLDAEPITVVAGDVSKLEQSGFEQIRQVSRIIPHDKYNPWNHHNDIAILLIASPFKVNKHVAPIALPRKNQKTSGPVIVSGWGHTSSGGSTSDVLQKVEVPIINNSRCQKAYPENTIFTSMLCAGLLGVGGKDACQGDSGGPARAMKGNYLAGVVSWGRGCADARYPGVYTEVTFFIDWLETVVSRRHDDLRMFINKIRKSVKSQKFTF